ncbi:MAG: hypothetical protein N3G21_08750 [Candidatus Hydrogenedentes bacterium]|nr:hypothetical protein [Candidatus Hydrogenedentota bacterium]
MRAIILRSTKIVFCLFVFLSLLVFESVSQPPTSGPGGRRFGQVDHIQPGAPPPPHQFSGPPGPLSQVEVLRPDGGFNGEVPAREVLEQIFLARVASQLRLSDEQTVIFLKKFMEFQEQNKELVQQRKKLTDSLRNTFKEKSGAINEGEIANLYDELVEIDRKIFNRKREFVEEVSQGLEIEKKVKLYLILSDFEEEMRKFLRKAYEWKQRRFKPSGSTSEFNPPPQEKGLE